MECSSGTSQGLTTSASIEYRVVSSIVASARRRGSHTSMQCELLLLSSPSLTTVLKAAASLVSVRKAPALQDAGMLGARYVCYASRKGSSRRPPDMLQVAPGSTRGGIFPQA